MKEETIKNKRKQRRVRRTKAKISQKRPRLAVFRSNKYIYAQIIDDIHGKTLVSSNESEIENKAMTKIQKAEEVGRSIAKKAHIKKIKEVVFDKRSYKYHGRVKSLAEGARKEGLVF